MIMSLSSAQLDAFTTLAKHLHFTKAAKELFITQPALTQRIARLEEAVGCLLFERGKRFVRLTVAGQRLVRYCQVKIALEEEALCEMVGKEEKELLGTVRLGGSSSHLRPLLIPSLGALASEQAKLHFSFLLRPMEDLPRLLLAGEADFIITTEAIDRAEIVSESVGDELFVMVSDVSRRGNRRDHFLGTDASDKILVQFMKGQKSSLQIPAKEETYMSDAFGILDGVELGYGSSIVPAHLIVHRRKIRVDRRYRPIKFPLSICYRRLPHYTKIQKVVLEELKKQIPRQLQPPKV